MMKANNPMSEQEFLESYELWADALFRHIRYRVFDREVARDLLQDVFMRAWEYTASGKRVEQMRAFLYRITNNCIIDYVRKKKSISLDELSETVGFDPEDNQHVQIHHSIEAGEAIRFLDKLSSDDRQLIVMRYLDDLRPKDIAGILEESENVVSVRLNRAIKKLQKVLNVTVPKNYER